MAKDGNSDTSFFFKWKTLFLRNFLKQKTSSGHVPGDELAQLRHRGTGVLSAFCHERSSSSGCGWAQSKTRAFFNIVQRWSKGFAYKIHEYKLRIPFPNCVCLLWWQWPFGHVVTHTSEANGNKGGVEFQRCSADFWEIPFNYFDVGQGPWEHRHRAPFSSALWFGESRKGQAHQATSKETNSNTPARKPPRCPSPGQWIRRPVHASKQRAPLGNRNKWTDTSHDTEEPQMHFAKRKTPKAIYCVIPFT